MMITTLEKQGYSFVNRMHPTKNLILKKIIHYSENIAPSGTSFDDYSQETVNTIFSHVNAVKRKNFNGKSAFDLFTFAYSTDWLRPWAFHILNLKTLSNRQNF